MEYFYAFQNWLYHTSFYQDILRKMPAPLNNIYFDSVFAIGLVIYLILRVVEAVRIACYRNHIRKKQAGERKLRREREEEVLIRERQVQEKEEKIGRFLDYMEFLFASRARRNENYEENCETQDSKPHRRRIGRRNLFLEKKNVSECPSDTVICAESEVSDYDVVMDAYDYDEKQEHEAVEHREMADERMKSNLHSLEKELKVEVQQELDPQPVEKMDVGYEKRKARAKLQEEKERKQAEKLEERQRKKGAWHGRLGKKG